MSETDIESAIEDAFGGMPSEPVEQRPRPDHFVVRCGECRFVVNRRTGAAATVVASDHATHEVHRVTVRAVEKPERIEVRLPAFWTDERTAEAIRSLKTEPDGVRFPGGVVVKTPALARFIRYGTPLPAPPTPPTPIKPPVHHEPADTWGGIIEGHLKELGLGVPKEKTLSDYKYRRLCFELAHGEEDPARGLIRIRTDDGDLVENGGRLRRGENRLRFYMGRTGWTVEEPKGGNN